MVVRMDPEASAIRPNLHLRAILAFWLPLAATWLMMSLEGPYIAAVVARLGAPVLNLAAYGLAFSLAWLAESPIIMLLTASTALTKDGPSFRALRRFVLLLNGGVSGLLLLIALPPVFRALTEGLLGLPGDVARLTHEAVLWLLPWPAAIGYRRFYQGILVRNHLTRRVAYGTLVRLATMSVVATALALQGRLPGASIGALSLSAGVVAEAAASRWMARKLVRGLLAEPVEGRSAPSMGGVARFYLPLALTSVIAMAVGPLLTFFMGRGPNAVYCLAAWPVVQSFVFFFRSGGVAFQEVGVALGAGGEAAAREVRRAAILLALVTSAVFSAILFTPLAAVWFRQVVGLGPELLAFALPAARLLVLLPALEFVLSQQRSRWILMERTGTVTAATLLEVGVISVGMTLLVSGLGWAGTLAAGAALSLGRLTSCGYLLAKGVESGGRT
jgi:hypothetical protein